METSIAPVLFFLFPKGWKPSQWIAKHNSTLIKKNLNFITFLEPLVQDLEKSFIEGETHWKSNVYLIELSQLPLE